MPLSEESDAPLYFNRELSWLSFNERVMEEAQNQKYPLLERLRFLAISADNLDEFYMVRVAGLRTQVIAGMASISLDGQTPSRQLDKIRKRAKYLIAAQQTQWKQLHKELYAEGIKVKSALKLSDKDKATLHAIYVSDILPLLTPLAIDPAHPFPFIPNFGFGLVLSLTQKQTAEGQTQIRPTNRKPKRRVVVDDNRKALLIVPAHVPRFIRIKKSSSGKRQTFVPLETVLKLFAPELFPGFDITDYGLFRVTRDSEIAIDEEAEDLVRHFEFLLKKRRRGRVIRLAMDSNTPEHLKSFLIESFEAWDEEIMEIDGVLGLGDLSQLITKQRPDLLFAPYKARFPERIREHDGDCFAAIAQKDILVHHPYEEFDVVVQFLQQAALDPDVVAIKQTLYRTNEGSPIVRALIDAAERGKNVTALVELKARFDEASNIRWARDLERAGAHVVYGFVDYKTHAKVSLVIRREGGKLRTYTHLGTGNYHVQNAKIYTDLALFTAKESIGRDTGQIFNFVTSYSKPKNLERLKIAPLNLRETLVEHIEDEIAHARAGRPATIWAKMNALVDQNIIDTLYRASQAGVQIDLVVRGICCLRPGIDGLSENIRVKSIVGRFLEHSRIVCFGNGEALPGPNALIYFSSADWMPRNLDRRIETLVPADDPTVRRQIMNQIMTANLLDNTNSWDLLPDGAYLRRQPSEAEPEFSAHIYFMENPSLSGRGASLEMNKPSDLKPVSRKRKTKSKDVTPKEAVQEKPVQEAGIQKGT
ncbi:MAG: RNA degradosome polyphosphate kinase [Robiginitomaculum sp.]|nr:MAG: RNA degradosome polyphosphate kinase [Robiginitomaculum sp.]